MAQPQNILCNMIFKHPIQPLEEAVSTLWTSAFIHAYASMCPA